MARIAVGGIQHETNVFAPYKAGYEVFAQRDEWPPLSRGMQMLDEIHGVNLPAAGAIQRLKALGHEIVPLLWCSATPSAHVREEAFERISAMMLETLRDSAPVDGVLLDLHGAMVCAHVTDGDGELLRRVRKAVGETTPVVASLDLHANISDQMAAQARSPEYHWHVDFHFPTCPRLVRQSLPTDSIKYRSMRQQITCWQKSKLAKASFAVDCTARKRLSPKP
jgi:microcystin degradation protein MlrC